MNTPTALLETQDAILKHHGGDGGIARQRITENFQLRHNDDFWAFWDAQMGVVHGAQDTILDLGAGIGQFVNACALRYPDATVKGIEVAPYMLEDPLALPSNACILVDDLNDPQAPIKAHSVSMVMANMLVHELTQPMKMFQAVRQWLKIGGRMCVIDVVRQPLQEYLQRRYPNTEMWQTQTTRAELEDAFEHFLEHNRYHPEDIVFMLESGGFKLISRESLRNGGQTRIVVEKIA